MPLEPNACDNCSAPVPVRKPSRSGKHFCARTKCQTAKQRFYRNVRATEAETTAAILAVELIGDLARGERSVCRCGLQDAVVGWAHRDPRDPLKACFGSGSKGTGLPTGALDAIHPDLRPRG